MERSPKTNDNRTLEARARTLTKASDAKIRLPEEPKTVLSIDWNTPGWETSSDDARWVAPETFDIGTSDWYKNLPLEEQIAATKYRMKSIIRKGGEFEGILIIGMTKIGMDLLSDDPVKAYMLTESEEEHRHMEMFDKAVNRIDGPEPDGVPNYVRNLGYVAAPVAKLLPLEFMTGVLAGEEPIDLVQKKLVTASDAGYPVHPMIDEVMRTHIAEEARHIGFADKYVEEGFTKLRLGEEALFAAAMPRIQRVLIDAILRPTTTDREHMNMPLDVSKELFWDSDTGQQTLYEVSTPMYKRAQRLGIAEHKLARGAWRAMGHGE